MKTLYMVRHAKSSWEHDVIDHQRPLNERGMQDAAMVSAKIKTEIVSPQKIISSDATRALSTARYFKEALEVSDANFNINHDLYDFGGQNVIKIIKELNNSLEWVMIVGHNHAFTSIANTHIDNVSTCGFLMLQFDVENWKNIRTGITVKTIFPRDLKK